MKSIFRAQNASELSEGLNINPYENINEEKQYNTDDSDVSVQMHK